jgi:D-amino-acid oxidase
MSNSLICKGVHMHNMNKIKNYGLSLALIFSVVTEVSAREIRKINPPRLEEAHLGKRILCHRPMRRGTPKMAIERIGNHVVAHNYGHGGSGWTLGPGSASYVNNLLETSDLATDLTKDTPITIIGAGALGLFSAYDLVSKGYRHITIVAEQFDDLTSHNAGGLLAPVSMDNDPKLQLIIDKIGVDAYKFYEAIAKKTHPIFSEGAVIVPTYFDNRAESGLEPYVGVVMQPAKDVTLDFGTGTTRDMVVYDDGIFMDTAHLMTLLTEYLEPHVAFVQKRVNHFDEIATKYIINCTGIGSAQLNSDDQLVSVQGHLIMLKDQNPEDLNLMILVYLNEATTKSGHKAKRSYYLFPKKLPNSGARDVGVVGGTFIEDSTSRTPNEEEFEIMLQGAKSFYGVQ